MAKQINTYNAKLNCIGCGKKVKRYTNKDISKKSNKRVVKETTDIHAHWKNATIAQIECSYGTSLAFNKYVIVVCDNCLQTKGIFVDNLLGDAEQVLKVKKELKAKGFKTNLKDHNNS